MNDYCYINENGDKIDYYELVNDNGMLCKEIEQLQQENQELKKQLENTNKQIEYLRRSVERKEETIIDLQNERIPYTNEYVCKLEAQQNIKVL